jgi:Fe-S cluster assembly iron-binding protein IscA
MLTLTQNADAAITRIVDASPLPDGSGLRIAQSPGQDDALSLTLVEEPEAGDRKVEEASVPVYVEPAVADVLSDRALDAEIDPQGETVSFMLVPGDGAEGSSAAG